MRGAFSRRGKQNYISRWEKRGVSDLSGRGKEKKGGGGISLLAAHLSMARSRIGSRSMGLGLDILASLLVFDMSKLKAEEGAHESFICNV